jgi:hypothetical protein
MPINKTQLRRLSAIVRILRDNKNQYVSNKTLQVKVSAAIDAEVCRSTIEKDLQHLRNEYDLDEYVETKKGLNGGHKMHTDVCFIELLGIHLDLIE